MAWDDTQVTGGTITATEWNTMVTYIKSVIEQSDKVDASSGTITSVVFTTATGSSATITTINGTHVSYSSGTISALECDNLTVNNNIPLGSNSISKIFTAGETVEALDICHIRSDGKFWKASSQSGTTGTSLLAVATGTISADSAGEFSILGPITTTGLTAGDILYLSGTDGESVSTAPSATGTIVRIIGHAISSTEFMFIPDNTWVEN